MKSNYHLAAGIICLFTALLHTIGGQLTLIEPLFKSALDIQVKSEILGAWHMVTVILWVFGIVLVKNARNALSENKGLLKTIGLLFLLFGVAFILISIRKQVHAPQYILFLPMALLVEIGNRKLEKVQL